MNRLLVATFLCLLAVELVDGYASGGPWLAVTFAVAGVAGVVGVVAFARRRAAAEDSRLSHEVEAGRVVWAAQVRPRLNGGRRGPCGGTLTLASDLVFRFEPNRWSLKHGAKSRSWPAGARLMFTETRRDLSGLSIHVLVLTPTDGVPATFDAYGLVGTLPQSSRGNV